MQAIDLEFLSIIKQKYLNLLESRSYPSYLSDIHQLIPETRQLISSHVFTQISNLLLDESPELCNIESHYLPAGSPAIPPHQDNFYHCVVNGTGLKVLIPMSDFSYSNGALIYLDCPSSIGTMSHLPSSIVNFSAEIDPILLSSLRCTKTSYSYRLGDASYHLLNSIHFSYGNTTNIPASFLVYRFQSTKSVVDNNMLETYQRCYQKHLTLLAT